MPREIGTVGVVGLGAMGSGITQLAIEAERRPPPNVASGGMAMCHVCRRTLLAGERYRTWRWARRNHSVCAVCEPSAHSAGAVRVVDAYESVRVGGLTQHVRRVA